MPPPLPAKAKSGSAKRAAAESPKSKDFNKTPKEAQACIDRAEKILNEWKTWSKEVLVHKKDK
eukprot:6151546-Prorocentrum_lima.AAC.1